MSRKLIAVAVCLFLLGDLVLVGLMFREPTWIAAEGGFFLEGIGDRRVGVGPGTAVLAGVEIDLPERATVSIPAVLELRVEDERHAGLPLPGRDRQRWLNGSRLMALRCDECTIGGHFDPGSVRVKAGPGESEPFVRGRDWDLEPYWGAVHRLVGGRIAADQAVWIDYVAHPQRLDRIVATPAGELHVVPGEPGFGRMLPPPLPAGTVAVAGVFTDAATEELTARHLFPIAPLPPREPDPEPARRIPRILTKLRAGEAVTIVFWGDSVVLGDYLGEDKEAVRYPERFAAALRERFPAAAVDLRIAAWPGQSSPVYFAARDGGPFDFARDVLAPEPDLVVHMFINDCGLETGAVGAYYRRFAEEIRGAGAELLLLTPHFARPGWQGMDVDLLQVDRDPRPWYAAARRFAAEEEVALVDSSIYWGGLWRRGIPYTTLLCNAVNHPDERGHAIFVEALLQAFPAPEPTADDQ